MGEPRVVIVGGGAAGFLAAVTCAEQSPGTRVVVLEKAPRFLGKVLISGGGRCNVTHACFDPRELSSYYPRGGSALIGPFHQFQPADTIKWFRYRGVELKTEPDGRVFPVSDRSETIIRCLQQAADAAGVILRPNCEVRTVRRAGNEFRIALSDGEILPCNRLMLATGGCRAAAAGGLALSLGHQLEPPVPSLFTFQSDAPVLAGLAGISVDPAEASVAGSKLRERGPVLITHTGLSGPAILRLSSWGARRLHELDYKFILRLNWLPERTGEALSADFSTRRSSQGARLIISTPGAPLPSRLWERLTLESGVPRDTRWAELSRPAQNRLIQQLHCTELTVNGKSLNKDEFVTCGGVRLDEVNFKTMESRLCPGLFFGGELLDIDGLTGGFNFQAAWTTGWIAGQAMSKR